MRERPVDAAGTEEVWRRLLALVTWSQRTERNFAMWCDINYNQWNNYKNGRKMPSRTMFDKVIEKTGVRYDFLRWGNMSLMPRELDEALTRLLKRNHRLS